MELLYYNELDYSSVSKNFKKVESFLLANDFKSADVKKMQNTSYYRAKLDAENRLLFKFAKYDSKTYILLLEVILNHEYEKSKFLRGRAIDESKIQLVEKESAIPAADIQNLVFLNRKQKHFHILDKIISFDDIQQDIYTLPTPLIIIGSAGSGKTVLTLEKLKQLKGNIAYISLSPFLVENAQNIYYSNNYENESQEIDFLSFKEYLESYRVPTGKEISFRYFEEWFNRHVQSSKIKESFRLFEEFKGVLTGSVIDKAYLTKGEYLNLGVKQSIFLQAQREEVYDIFTKYINFLNENKFYDLNILSFEYLHLAKPKYDFIVVDEVQDITNIQLKLILSSLKSSVNFVLSGDSNQIVHPNFFSWSKIKTMFYLSDLHANLIRIMTTNYRNSQQITDLSNTLLRIKNVRFGSIDKESTYLIDSVSPVVGEINLLEDKDKVKNELNNKTQNSTKFAVLVMNNSDKSLARKFFKTPLIFSIQEAKGLEYENVILLNFVSSYDKEFFEITKGVDPNALCDELVYARARNKEDKDLEVYKFFINSLYVAITRAIKNLFIIESNKSHKLFELLKLKEATQQLTLQTEKSNEEDWLNEARRLELQGKYEQAQQIRDRIMGVEYISPEAYIELKRIALDATKTEDEVKKERKHLFAIASARRDLKPIQALANLKFLRAIVFMKEVKQAQKEFAKDCRLNRLQSLPVITKKFGVDFRSDEEEMTGLMLACHYGAMITYEHFIKNEANKRLKNKENLTVLQIAIRSLYRKNIIQKPQSSYLQINDFATIYPQIVTHNIRYIFEERLVKVGAHLMEYFLYNFIIAVRDDIISNDFDDKDKGLSMSQFVEFIEILPNSVMPEYRKKRTYINSILANSEIDSKYVYNRKVFKRTARGCYAINNDIFEIEDDVI